MAARPKKTEGEKMEKFNFSLHPEDVDYLKDQAQKSRKSGMSEYLRELIAKDRQEKEKASEKPS